MTCFCNFIEVGTSLGLNDEMLVDFSTLVFDVQ